MIRKFSIEKYKEYFKSKRNLKEEDVDNLIYLNNMDKLDGIKQSDLEDKGNIILDEWCDEVEDET